MTRPGRGRIRRSYLTIALLPLLLAACGGVPNDVVVLLPEADGTVGIIEVSNADASRQLSRPRQAVGLRPGRAPGEVVTLQGQEVDRIFARAIAAQPRPPERFILYFETGTTRLTPESEAQLPMILQAIERRPVPEVDISGHTDTAGTRDLNRALARARADAVRDAIIAIGVDPARVTVSSHGENNPLVPTPDGVAEPRNRRVEAVVR